MPPQGVIPVHLDPYEEEICRREAEYEGNPGWMRKRCRVLLLRHEGHVGQEAADAARVDIHTMYTVIHIWEKEGLRGVLSLNDPAVHVTPDQIEQLYVMVNDPDTKEKRRKAVLGFIYVAYGFTASAAARRAGCAPATLMSLIRIWNEEGQEAFCRRINPASITLSTEERIRMMNAAQDPQVPEIVRKRCQILLLLNRGVSQRRAAEQLGMSPIFPAKTVRRWRERGIEAVLVYKSRIVRKNG